MTMCHSEKLQLATLLQAVALPESMIAIKHKFSGATLCEFDVATVREAAEQGKSNLRGANLDGANLRGANLYGANLDGSNLDGEKISKPPLSLVGLHYWCMISDGFMRLGCKRFTHAEWSAFSDDEISDMDSNALEFWRQWKAPLMAMCAAHSVVAQVEELAA